jgi:alpha-mannosidase
MCPEFKNLFEVAGRLMTKVIAATSICPTRNFASPVMTFDATKVLRETRA